MYKKNHFICALAGILALSPFMTFAMQQNNPPREKCVVCYEKLSKKKFRNVVLACEHTFHTECIWKWGTEKTDCPLCRKECSIILEKEHIEALDMHRIKDILNIQHLKIYDMSGLPAPAFKKILLLAGSVERYKKTLKPVNNETQVLPIDRQQQDDLAEIEDARRHKKGVMMAAVRTMFFFTIVATLLSIYPKKIADDHFKMIALFLSMVGFFVTCVYPEEFAELTEE